MSEIWKQKAIELRDKIKAEYARTGNIDARKVEKVSILLGAAERCDAKSAI